MKLIIISTIALIALVKVSSAATGIKVGPVQHVREDTGVCVCEGIEIKDKKKQREFRLLCSITKLVKTKEGKKTKTEKKLVWHTSCIYGGNPHNCDDYNNNGQTKFYEGLLVAMATDYCDENLAILACKEDATYHSNICTDVPFTFNRKR